LCPAHSGRPIEESGKISIQELRKRVARIKQRRYSLPNRIMLWANYAFIVALLVAVSAKYISPAFFWLPAFFGLAFPHFFILNCLFLVYWMAQLKPVLGFGIIALLLALPTAYRYVQVSLPAEKSENKPLKVTSFNCMLFDLYNWNNNRNSRKLILGTLSEIDPEIICLQEFYTSEEKGDFNNIDTVRKTLRMPYYHAEFTTTLRGYDHWGVATFSKYPIVRQGKLVFKTRSNNICIFSDVVLNKDTVRIYNLHLQSISFSRQDNKFLEDVMAQKDRSDEVKAGTNILRRLKRAFVKRTAQVDLIVTHMRTSRYPVILCGDFNDTAASYAYQQLSSGLEDSFIEKGVGFGITYAGKWPQFRIDYILHSDELNCSDYRRGRETFTDHFPITAYFDNINWRD
jgi:endonuclease/exonuclease/phosphatase family metal-dependent hydrolase